MNSLALFFESYSKSINSRQEFCNEHNEHYLTTLFNTPHGQRWIGKCSSCQEKRNIELIRAERLQMQQQYQQNLAKVLFNQSAIPPYYAKSDFNSYIADSQEKQMVKNTLLQFAHNIQANLKMGRNLILAGNVGTGKGHLAVSVAKAAINNGHSAFFTSVGEMSDKINCAGFAKEPVVQNFIKPDLLILDEIAHNMNNLVQENLFKVLNGRALQVKSTIVITNLSMEELKTVLGERIIDRLRDHGSCALFFTWESGRK